MSEASKTTAIQWAQAMYGSQEVTQEVVKEMQELDAKWSGMVPNLHDTQPVDLFKNFVNPIPGVNVDKELVEIKKDLNPSYSEDRDLASQIDTAVSVTEDTPLHKTAIYYKVVDQEPDQLTKFLIEPEPITSLLELDNGEVLKMTSDPNFKQKLSGGKVNYYLVWVQNPQREEQAPYQAECEDIIEALRLNFDEGNIFKEIWRTANERNGNGKPGNNTVRAAEKIKHYAERILKRAKREQK